MIGLGFAEILMMALMGGGVNSTDLVSLVQPAHYFQSRQIDVSFDKMVELAGLEPKDAKTQIQQLVALRHLADESEKLKKAEKYIILRATIEQIAQGKKGADVTGFAQDYAQRVLDKLDGTKREPAKTKPVREEALAWFPADITFGAAIEMRPTNPQANDPFKDLLKLLPENAKKEMYEFIEKSGNVRVERVAFGFAGEERGKQKIFVRLTGKANHTWLAETFKTLSNGRFESKQMKDANGTPITIMHQPKREPMILMVGNNDIVIGGYDQFDGKHDELAPEILDARAKKKPNAAAGKLKDDLAKVPENAVAFAVGGIPGELKREFQGGFGAVPDKIVAFAERTQLGLDVQVQAKMANAEDSKTMVQKVSQLRKEGIAGLQQAMNQPLPPNFPPVPFQALINVLESLQVQSNDEKAQLRVVLPNGLIEQMGTMGMMVFGVARELAPPPPPKEEKK